MKPSVEHFAFVVDQHGIHPSPHKVQAIQEVPEPQNATELKSFLGMVNYYRKFIPDMSTLVHPLKRLLMFHALWAWTETCQVAFKKLNELLLKAGVHMNRSEIYSIIKKELLGLRWIRNTTRQLTTPNESPRLLGDCLVSVF